MRSGSVAHTLAAPVHLRTRDKAITSVVGKRPASTRVWMRMSGSRWAGGEEELVEKY